MSNPKIIEHVIETFKTMNQKAERNLLPKNVGYYAGNVRYDTEYGSIAKRLSRANYNTASVGTFEIPALYRFYKNTTNSAILIAGYNGSLTVGYDNFATFSNIKTGLTSNTWNFLTYKDLCYMFNGEDANQVFTFSTHTTAINSMGVPSASTPSGTVSATTGNLSGTLYWAISYQFDGYQEGNVSPSSAGVAVTASRCSVGIPTSPNTRCTGRYLYRTKSNTTTMYRVATISGNSPAFYGDNIADSSLDTTIVAPTDYGVPASYRYGCIHKERIFLAWNKTHPSWIIFTDIRNGTSYPDVFPANNYLKIAEDDGDETSFIKNDNLNQLIVAKKNSIRIIHTTTDSPNSWSISDSFSPQGCIAPYSAAVTPIGIIYLTRYGENKKRLVLWTGNGIQIIPQLEGVENILTDIPASMLEKIKGFYHNGYYYFAYCDPTGGEQFNNRIMIVDIFNDWAVSIDKKNIASFASWNSGSDWGELYTGSSDTSGYVVREDAGSFDLKIRHRSEINQGINSFTQNFGIENYPSIGLLSNVSGVGCATWSTAGIWSQYTGQFDTWWLNGQWVDTIREISAKVLGALYWKEITTDTSEIMFQIRTGSTEVACLAASWQRFVKNDLGEDISDITAAKFVQIKAILFSKYLENYDEPYLIRGGIEDSDYIIKLSSNYGTPNETTIEFEWQSGKIDLGDINEVYKRLRKRLRSVKVEYERESVDNGNLDFYWYLDGTPSATGNFNMSFTTYPKQRIYNFPLSTFCHDFMYRLYSNSDTKDLKIKKLLFTISTEPYFVNK